MTSFEIFSKILGSCWIIRWRESYLQGSRHFAKKQILLSLIEFSAVFTAEKIPNLLIWEGMSFEYYRSSEAV